MFKLFKNFNKKDFFIILTILALIVGQVYLELKIPDYMSEITRLVETEGSKMSDILVQGGYMLLCALISLVSACIVGYLTSKTSATLSKRIRKKLFMKVQEFGMEEMKSFSVASLITRTTNDITQIEMFIAMGLQMLIKSPIMAVWAVCKILNKGIEWSIATGVALLILIVVIIILMILVIPNFKKVQKYIDDVNNVARENLKGIRVVHAYNAEEYEQEKFGQKNNNLTKIQMFNQKTMALMQPMMYLVMHALTLSIYIIGAFLIEDAIITAKIEVFSNMVVFSSYAMQVLMSFLMLTAIFIIYPRANVSAKRINEVLNAESSIKDGNVSKTDEKNIGTIEFKDVSFKYPDGQDYVLKDISFKVNKGETLAIIGGTGSGKSTLVNLIPRFYDATEGNIFVDGVNVKDYNSKYLYNKIGYVPQKAVLFKDTVENNIDYGENDNKKNSISVKEAARIAQASEFIESMKDGYQDEISQSGTNLSGGQKQRISIARAIKKNPEIFIFDDSFSALDYKTDATLRCELKKNYSDKTNIIVAQRVGTIMDADKILVLDEGKCVGLGTHKELLENCKVYKEIAYSQFREEELASE